MDVMLDLETMGTRPGCVIATLGAVTFDLWNAELERQELYIKFSWPSQTVDHGMVIDGDTVRWWLRQSVEAQRELTSVQDEVHLTHGLRKFSDWWDNLHPTCVWSHGAGFDVPIVEDAMRRTGIKPPWRYGNIRDTRTLYALAWPEGDGAPWKRTGTAHHAISDCHAQITRCLDAVTALRIRADGSEIDGL